MKYKDIKKRLELLGCEFLYSCKGSHRIRHNPKIQADFTVVDHGAKETIASTISKMLKIAGISREEFLNINTK